MAFSSTAAVLDSIKTTIEALTPASVVGPDDKYRVYPEQVEAVTGSRTVEVTGFGAKRKLPSATCNAWETQIEVSVSYVSTPVEAGAQTIHQVALRDSEDLLDALYTWATTTDGINRISPELASVQEDGEGLITSTRTIQVEFIRG